MTNRLVCLGRRAAVAVGVAVVATTLMFGADANAAIVPKVALATSAQYAVLGGSTVTNTGNSVLNGSLGLSPGPSITGFPPGLVVPPGTTNATNAAATNAQADLTTAYVDAAGRSVSATTTADLGNSHLGAGVYAGPGHGALSLTGPLVLDGAGDASSVFIFQTNSSLTTASSSTVTLVNGAQECNVFWQVGSSATLGTGSVFVGNILALTSITVTSGVTVHGRALARNGAVTLDNDVFTRPTCATTFPPAGTPTTPVTMPSTTPPAAGGGSGGFGAGGSGAGTSGSGASGSGTSSGSGVPPVIGPPRTDAIPVSTRDLPVPALVISGLMGAAGAGVAVVNRRDRARRERVYRTRVGGGFARSSR